MQFYNKKFIGYDTCIHLKKYTMPTRHTNIPASYLILKQKNKILLTRRFNTGFEDGKYSMIAGHLDPNEPFSAAIIREAKEEAGIIVATKDLKVVHVMHRKSSDSERVDVFFIAEKWTGELTNKEPHKCDDFSWFNLDKLPENIIPYLKIVLHNIRKNIFYSEYGWVSNIKRRIMYIELKKEKNSGHGRIGWVEMSKTGRSYHYQGKTFKKIRGGFKHNCFDTETGEQYWISGPKKDGSDTLYGKGIVKIDDDAREEYWITIRNLPKKVTQQEYNTARRYNS